MFKPHLVRIPPTTNKTIIFPYDPRIKGLHTNHFNPELIDNRASSEEINKVLFEIELILRLYEPNSTPTSQSIKGFLLVFLVVYIILVCLGTIPGLILVIVGVVFLALGFLFGFAYSNCYNSSYREGKSLIQAVLKRFNPEFNAKELSWWMPDDSLYWVELRKDYIRGEEVSQNMGVGIEVEDKREEGFQELLKNSL